MTSPVSDLLAQEKVCTDLFRTISESVEAVSHTSTDIASPVNFSDDVIVNLLEQMVQILPPEERNIFGEAEEKNIEDIIQEANELIRTTTPLFSSSESYEKSSTTAHKGESKNEISNDVVYPEEVTKSEVKSESDSICSSLEGILMRDNDPSCPEKTEEGKLEIPVVSIARNNVNDALEEMYIPEKLTINYDEIPAAPNLRVLQQTQGKMKSPNDFDLINKISSNTVSHAYEKSREVAVLNEETKGSVHPTSSVHQDPESNLGLIKQKYTAQEESLKDAHRKEVHGLTEEIHHLNEKIHKMKLNNKTDKSTINECNQLERLKNELKSQEELLFGYEKENKKLCKEMASLKEAWKHKEIKLVEEKRRIQNELQGMVSKVTTEALEEQLKDARETIVKLQIELTSYKSRNKELEVSCERLREESLRLQTDLSHCHCDRTPCRRDKYSFLASSNVGTQINQLKAVIARKDIEIAQMNTTLGILQGEINNKCASIPGIYNQQLESHNLTISQLQAALAEEKQAAKDLAKEKELVLKENLDLKRQVRELETIVKRRQRSDSCFPVTVNEAQSTSRLLELEKELSSRQEALSALHLQFLNMQKKYEDHIHEIEARLKESREELNNLKSSYKKEQSSNLRVNTKKVKPMNTNVKEETHLLATIRGLRQEAANREKEMNKLNKEIEEVRQTNKRLQKEREKQLNSIPSKMATIKDKVILRKVDKSNSNPESRANVTSPNNNMNPIVLAELQEANLLLKSKTKGLQEEVKRLEQDLIAMHNKRVHDLNVLQNEHEVEMSRLMEERAAFLSQGSAAELQGQLYTQQMVINHLKNRLKQMEELKNEVTLLRAERDHLEQSLGAVNKKMCYLQNAQSPESIQYKTLLEKLETLEKNQELREQKLNAVRELLSRTTQGQSQGTCGGTCRDKLLDKNRQICFYRAQMDRILETLLDIRRTK